MNFTNLKDSIAGTELQALQAFVTDEFLDSIRYGDHYRWRRLVADLPAMEIPNSSPSWKLHCVSWSPGAKVLLSYLVFISKVNGSHSSNGLGWHEKLLHSRGVEYWM